MAIRKHIEVFNNKKAIDFEIGMELDHSMVYRIRTDYEMPSFDEHLTDFLSKPNVSELEELIIGAWYENIGEGAEPDLDFLKDHKDKLPNLKYLMIGDITQEECEMSWIATGDYSCVVETFPDLVHLQCRTGEEYELTFGELHLNNLETLIIESGGLPSVTVEEVLQAQLPKLSHLQLWLGAKHYGFDGSVETLQDLLAGKLFPSLTYLGINNCEIINEVTEALLTAPILDRIETLDLSGGNLTDEGAQHLLDNPKIKNLKHLNLRHHFLSKEMEAKFQALLGDKVNLTENRHGKSYYIEVGE